MSVILNFSFRLLQKTCNFHGEVNNVIWSKHKMMFLTNNYIIQFQFLLNRIYLVQLRDSNLTSIFFTTLGYNSKQIMVYCSLPWQSFSKWAIFRWVCQSGHISPTYWVTRPADLTDETPTEYAPLAISANGMSRIKSSSYLPSAGNK